MLGKGGNYIPWYDWRASCCGCEAHTIREIDDRDTPPEAACNCGKTRTGDGKWEREIKNVHTQRGSSWGGSKGNW